MSTNLFPTASAITVTSSDWTLSPTTKLLSLSRGAGVQTQTDNTVASLDGSFVNGTNIAAWGSATAQNLQSGPGPDWAAGTLVFVTNPLNAVTISGAISMNIRASESNAMANYLAGCVVFRLQAGFSNTASIIRDALVSTTELGTSEAVRTNSQTPTTGITVSDGDRIAIVFGYAGTGTSASGFTASGFYAGASGATGDTFVTFTETITEQVTPTPPGPYVNPMPPLLAQ